ncbi:MAG: hypothetical protein NC205_05575 [Prevotella sp.]|nr:hypothetical protein [Alistipes senegalensis]MCM1358045.1 hypothetical protein [Prevotella sp.]MCM1472900.1 hypothetical protein [Muribaculaceae bacterium]MDE6427033.1 hypothetical protein [Ruminococcus sp.]
MNENFYTYKGYPLVRCRNTIYYGYMSDDYVIMMNIMSKQKINDMEVAGKVKVIQMSTDPTLDPLKACTRNMECIGLYEALDTAYIWLEKALNK